MTGLPSELYRRCRALLLRCAEFDSNAALCAVFVTIELAPFRNGLPETGAKSARVDAVLAYLLNKQLGDGRAVLPLFLTALVERHDPADALHGELEALAQDVMEVLSSSPRPPAAAKLDNPASTEDGALAMARRALAHLEEQLAGFGALHAPAHLVIEVEEKRRQVAEMEARLGGATGAPSPARHSERSEESRIFDQRGQQVGTQINVAGDYIAVQGDGNVVGDDDTVAVDKGADPAGPHELE